MLIVETFGEPFRYIVYTGISWAILDDFGPTLFNSTYTRVVKCGDEDHFFSPLPKQMIWR